MALSVREGVDVKLVPCLDGTEELYVLARSAARIEKEQAMNERFPHPDAPKKSPSGVLSP
jgi:hypothetical protein